MFYTFLHLFRYEKRSGTPAAITHMKEDGFTLIELLITMAVIGIIAAIAITSYVGAMTKAARSEAYSNLESIRLLEEQVFADTGDYTTVDLGAPCGEPATVAERDANLTAIQAVLQRFRPGNAAQFCYQVIADVALTPPVAVPYNDVSVPQATPPCFIATATGLDNTRVETDEFVIDCNNNRNF